MSEGRPYPLPCLDKLSSEPIPVRKAVELFFPYGGIKPATLMAEIRRGNLAHIRLGRTYFVTDQDIQEWVSKCRQKPKEHVSISGTAKDANPSGLSETDRNRLAQDVAKSVSEQLSKGLPIISGVGLGPTPANVISIKSTLPKS